MIFHLNLDIICLCETFLIKEEVISLPGYVWYGNNRKSISKRAIRGSGGVGILVKDWLVHQCDVHILDNSYEGILWLQLTNKQTQYSLGVCVCYLPQMITCLTHTHKRIMSFPSLSVNISPASFLEYTTYSSRTVASPMTTKKIGGTVRSETGDTIIHVTQDIYTKAIIMLKSFLLSL